MYVVEKIESKHKVTQDEVEEVFFNILRYRLIESGYRHNEDVHSTSGQADAGRYLIVFFIYKQDNTALILSARDMDKKERKGYEKK
jgi:uncharacterized DUF497 family protein